MRAFVLILAAVLLSGCGGEGGTKSSGGPTPSSGEKGKKLRIAVIPKGTTHEFWKSVHAGAKQAAGEIGDVEIVFQGPANEADIEGQIGKVRAMIVNRVDGIVLAPNHSGSLTKVVKEANAAKIPVVIFDSALDEGPQTVSYVATDNENGGKLAAQRLAELLGDKGNVILLRYRTGSESTEMREKGFLEEMKKHSDIKVLSDNQHGEDTTEKAKAKTADLLLKFQDQGVDGLFAVCESNCNGALRALEDAGLAGKVKYIAFDPSAQLIEGLKNDSVHGIVLQDPVRMGYLAVKTLVASIRGEQVEKRIPTGEHVATKENMETEEFQKLLHPKQQE
jgi:ribose transport system substrate-binding protein